MMMDWHPKELSPPQEHVLASMQQQSFKNKFLRVFIDLTITKRKLMVSLFKPYSPKEKSQQTNYI
jgi:hypothetical protein